jgi:uncharacterized coiled-coil protein SlyX
MKDYMEAEKLITEINMLISQGKSKEANKLKEKLNDIWNNLTKGEQEYLKNLSEEL